MESSWEAVLSVVASVTQILGVDVMALILLVNKLLCLSSCRAECAKLKERVTELEALNQLSAGGDPHVQSVIDDANDAVDAYNGSSVFRVIWSSRRLESEMVQKRRRVKLCVSGLIHAGVAASWATPQP
ncbi:hypothetical protein BS78_09G000600 [Paspalum vaginatum]|nr:hypothetical protein BS78_09G000600 [Paspalum vaginatum]